MIYTIQLADYISQLEIRQLEMIWPETSLGATSSLYSWLTRLAYAYVTDLCFDLYFECESKRDMCEWWERVFRIAGFREGFSGVKKGVAVSLDVVILQLYIFDWYLLLFYERIYVLTYTVWE